MRGLFIEDAIPNPVFKEFLIVRENALANPNLYGGRYTQENIEDAYEEYKLDLLKKGEN